MTSEAHPYHAMHKLDYLKGAREAASEHGVAFIEESVHHDVSPSLVFDTRPPRAPAGAMLQHFAGMEVEVDRPVFDPQTAILMDFRVDQSHGMHFMYVLPFSPTRALLESTMFSTSVMPHDYYKEAIESYLFKHHKATIEQVICEEQGSFRWAHWDFTTLRFPVWANGGAIRPASGYTFAFIHQQIEEAIERVKGGKPLKFTRPHKRVDVWMDSVLLAVLRHWPHQGPILFSRMAQSLSGEKFIRFMSGKAGWWLRFKVMMAMPKMPFIRGVSKMMFSRPRKVVS